MVVGGIRNKLLPFSTGDGPPRLYLFGLLRLVVSHNRRNGWTRRNDGSAAAQPAHLPFLGDMIYYLHRIAVPRPRWIVRRPRRIVLRGLRYRGYYTRHDEGTGRARGRICEQHAHRGHKCGGMNWVLRIPRDIETAIFSEEQAALFPFGPLGGNCCCLMSVLFPSRAITTADA